MPTSQEVTRKPGDAKKKKVTSKDVPGSGMARKAAEAIEHRIAKRKEVLRNL